MCLLICSTQLFSQEIEWDGRVFEEVSVNASVVQFNGEEVLKVERDLDQLPFDINNLSETVDEPTYVKLNNFNLEKGVIEVKMLSRIQSPSPFKNSQGFIGIAFRISEDNSKYESIYLRPNAGRSGSQVVRNHTVQYYSYPDYKFDRLRRESNGEYETYADVGLDEWITIRIEVEESIAKLFINDQKYPSFIVNEMKGNLDAGGIGLWVDIGTEGYFKDLRIITRG